LGKPYDNRQLIQGIADHDRESVRHVIQQMQKVIVHVLMKRNASREQAEDIFMDSLEAIYREILKNGVEATVQKLENPRKTKLQTYLTQVNLHLLYNQLRRNKVQSGVTKAQEKLYKDEELVTEQIHEVEQRRLFTQKMQNLDDGCQQILQMFFQKNPMKDIAEKMGLSEKYIKKRKFQCKEKLIQMIQQDALYPELSR
jgi:RNA polymerase sigma factor (sigma-70 family)